MLSGNTPIFQIEAVLIDSHVNLNPFVNEIGKVIIQNLTHLLNGMKMFPKWRKGTCITFSQELTMDHTTNYFEDIYYDKVIP